MEKPLEDLLRRLSGFTIMGSSLLILPVEEEKGERKTDSGILLVGDTERQEIRKAEVLRAGKGFVNDAGVYIKNPIQVGAIIYYKKAWESELDGIKFHSTELSQVAAYRNPPQEQ